MNDHELELTLLELRTAIKLLEVKVEGLEKELDQHYKHSDEWDELERKHSDKEFLNRWRTKCQLWTLRDLLFELADKTGHSQEQMVAEYDRRWKKLLDENLRRLEDNNPNLAGRVDERDEDEIPD